jgi:hypothetical protein
MSLNMNENTLAVVLHGAEEVELAREMIDERAESHALHHPRNMNL